MAPKQLQFLNPGLKTLEWNCCCEPGEGALPVTDQRYNEEHVCAHEKAILQVGKGIMMDY